MGDAYFLEGKYDKAEKEYIEAEKDGAKGVALHFCIVYDAKSEFDKMEEYCSKAEGFSDGNDRGEHGIGQASMLLGYAHIQKTLLGDAGKEEMSKAAKKEIEAGIIEAAAGTAKMATTDDKDQTEQGYLYQAYGYAALGDRKNALDLLHRVKLLSSPMHTNYYFYAQECAEVYSALNMLREASVFLKESFQKNWSQSMKWYDSGKDKPSLSPLLKNLRPYVRIHPEKKTVECKI